MFRKDQAITHERAGLSYRQIARVYGKSGERIRQWYKEVLGRPKDDKYRKQRLIDKRLAGTCLKCNASFVRNSPANKLCPKCLRITRVKHLQAIKQTEKYRTGLSNAKKRWWAVNKEVRKKLSEKMKEAWKIKKGERNEVQGKAGKDNT